MYQEDEGVICRSCRTECNVETAFRMVHLEDESGAFFNISVGSCLQPFFAFFWLQFRLEQPEVLSLGSVACAWLVSTTVVEERIQLTPVLTHCWWGVCYSCQRPRTGSWGLQEAGQILCMKQGMEGAFPASRVGTPPHTCMPELGEYLALLWNSETISDFMD